MTEFAARVRAVQKRKLFEQLLGQGIAALHLDPRHPGVLLPDNLKDQPVLVLNYSHRYGVGDFRFDDKGVEATLSFSKQPSFTTIPWLAVFAVTTDSRSQGTVWQEDLPAELALRELAASPPTAEPSPRSKLSVAAARKARPTGERQSGGKSSPAKPSRVSASEAAEPPEVASTAQGTGSLPTRPNLRLVALPESAPAAPAAVPEPSSVQPQDPADPPPRPAAGGHLRRIK